MAEDENYGRSDESRARRRRSAVTLTVVLLVVFFAAWYALSYIRAEGAAGTPSTTTNSSPTCGMSPQQVEVNVYNATDRDGLAGQVAQELKKRGFMVKTVANDPKKSELTGRGQLRYGNNGKKGAELLGLHTGTFDKIQDVRKRTTVDVVIGPKYQHLAQESSIKPC